MFLSISAIRSFISLVGVAKSGSSYSELQNSKASKKAASSLSISDRVAKMPLLNVGLCTG